MALSPQDAVLVALSAAVAGRDAQALEEALHRASRGAEPEAVEEALLQSYLFLGYPVALNALAAWRGVSGAPSPGGQPVEPEAWADRGTRVCRVVYGGQYDRLRENVRALHPEMERWMVEEGYGKVLGRPGLSLRRRELCIVALLAVLDTPRQLHSHLRGALNAGASPDEVRAALAIAAGFATAGARERADTVWAEVRHRMGVEP